MRSDIAALDGARFDVVVIGGGISGASSAQHLAAAGYHVLLVEKDDFASAATSRSGRLLHCGLRYLAPAYSLLEFVRHPGRFFTALGAARRSITSSTEFRRTTPERARPMTLLFAITRQMPYRGWQVRLGARLLEWVNLGRQSLNARIHDAVSAKANLPFIGWLRDTDDLVEVVTFEDHQFDWPERITLDAVLDAERLGATVRNYTTARRMERQEDGAWRLTIEDNPTGRTVAVTAPVVLNMAGPWIDVVNGTATGHSAPRKVVGVKGTHILVRLPPHCRGHGIMANHRGGEAITCMPWGELHYVGPTEEVYEGSLEDVRPEEAEVRFLLDEINYLMPGIALRREDVLQAWAGVRPINYDPALPKGRRMPFSLFHDLSAEGLPNVMTTTWAAIMFHRSAAREVLAAVRRKITPSRAPRPASFAARSFPENQNSPPLLPHHPEVKLADIRFAAEREHPAHLVDILFRRTSAGWHASIPPEAVEKAAEVAGDVLGWDAIRREEEVAAFRAYYARYHLQDGAAEWRA